MMRIKIQMLAMMFIAALALGACSDDDDKDDVKVPEAMSQALKSKYPSAIHVESLFISPNTLSYSTLLKTTNSKRYKF